jgi:predicted dehydrogenase
MAPLRVGIAGAGGVARYHANNFRDAGGVTLAAVADVDRGAAEAFAAQYDIPQVYTDAEQMIAEADLQAISICTPDSSHHPIALAALEAGLPVLCEKPLAMNVAQAREMVAAAARAGVLTAVNFSHRARPGVQLLHRLINDGYLGEISHFEVSYLQSWLMFDAYLARPALRWRLDKTVAAAGVLADLGVHITDMARFLVGEFASVCGLVWHDTRERRAGEGGPVVQVTVDDAGAYLAEFARGATGVFHTSRVAPGRGDYLRIEVYGQEGSALFQSDRNDRVLACLGPLQRQRRVFTEYVVQEEDLAYKSPIHAFVQNLRGGHIPAPTFTDGLRAQEVLAAVLRSAQERRWLTVGDEE